MAMTLILQCRKTPMPCAVVTPVNISLLEAALDVVQCSQGPLLQAGIAVQQPEVLQECVNLLCDDLFQHKYRPANADPLPGLCSSKHSIRALAHEWLQLHADHEGLSFVHVLFQFPASLDWLDSWKKRSGRE